MSFLSPLMLLGLLGAMIPIAIHLQGRRKAKVVPFAALDFLLGTDKRIAKRLMFRQVLLLAFRMLICMVAAIILARPYTSCRSLGPKVAQGPQAAVLIIDNSAAAGYELDGQTLLSRSLESASQLLVQLGPEADVAVLTTTGGGKEELSRDHLGLRETLNSTPLSYRKARGDQALQRALALLAGAGHERKSIFLLVAPTEATLPTAFEAPADIGVRVLSPSKKASLENLAVTDLEVSTDTSIGSRGLRITARVSNFGDTAQVAHLSLRVGDEIVARGEVSLAPHESKNKRFSASLSEGVRTAEIQVELQDDALEADNIRYVVANARDEVSVLLVNGDARAVRHEDELYYVEAALRPGDRSDSGTIIARATPENLGPLTLSDYDVIILANVPVLPGAQVRALSEWVLAGGGLLVSMGDSVDADRYNRSMGPLLAQELRSALDLRRGRKRSPQAELRLSKLELEHPVFSVFAKDAPGLYSASFWQVMLLGPTTSVKNRRVLARFDNGAAALVEARQGKGTLMLLSSTLDRDWNNLAIHPGFLPFLQQSVRHLASKPLQRANQQVLVGDYVPIDIGAGDVRIEIAGPGRERMVLEGDKIEGHKSARLDGIEVPGLYHVSSVDGSGAIKARPEATFAANLDPTLGDLTLKATNSLERDGTRGEGEQATPSRRIELWHSIAALLLLLLLLESCLSLVGRRTGLVRDS
ncbi:MAG: hypothetical protein GY811_07820 [Myxococcales bacterium]|nr:hypothetical protein [Myxococcales bacterium]